MLIQPYEEKVGNDACLTCSRVNLRANFVIPTRLSSPLLLQMRNTNRRHVYIIAPLLENIGRYFSFGSLNKRSDTYKVAFICKGAATVAKTV